MCNNNDPQTLIAISGPAESMISGVMIKELDVIAEEALVVSSPAGRY